MVVNATTDDHNHCDDDVDHDDGKSMDECAGGDE